MKLSERIRRIPRALKKDDRGWFLKVIDGKEQDLPQHTGEVYLTLAPPGQQRGSHYHPVCNEWFTIVEGTAEALLEDPTTHERLTLTLDADTAETLFVPAGVAHVFRNREPNRNFLLVAYADQLYDPADTIPYKFEPVDE